MYYFPLLIQGKLTILFSLSGSISLIHSYDLLGISGTDSFPAVTQSTARQLESPSSHFKFSRFALVEKKTFVFLASETASQKLNYTKI